MRFPAHWARRARICGQEPTRTQPACFVFIPLSVRGCDSLVAKEEADLLVEEFVQRDRRWTGRVRDVACGREEEEDDDPATSSVSVVVVREPKGPSKQIDRTWGI